MVNLPYELWDNIFHLAAEDDDKRHFHALKTNYAGFELPCHSRTLKPSIKPLILVCHLWKEVIVRSNDFHVMSIESRTKGVPFKKFSYLLKGYTRWLKNSKGCDIDISFVPARSEWNTSFDIGREELSQLLQLFLPYLSRVRILVMGPDYAKDLVSVFPFNAPFPRLRCFALKTKRASVIPQTSFSFPAITPYLTHLFLHEALLSSEYISTISNVTSLKMTGIKLVSVANTLSHLPRLECVHLEVPKEENQMENEPTVMPQNRCPRLLDVYLENGPWSEILDVLGRSSLQNLTIVQPNHPLINIAVARYHPDSLSLPNLRTITLTMPLASIAEILTLCTKCPSLQFMTLLFNEDAAKEIKMRVATPSLPSLKHLIIRARSYYIHVLVLSLFDASNLVSLDLQMPAYYTKEFEEQRAIGDKSMTVHLPNLVELKLNYCVDPRQASWLRNLIIPSLKKLSLLTSETDGLVKEWDLLNSDFRNILEGLECLALRTNFDPLLMTNLCQCTKNVTTLGLDLIVNPKQCVESLSFVTGRTTSQKEDVGRDVLLPRLSKLEILRLSNELTIVKALKGLVLRRKEEEVPLARIEVDPDSHRFSLADQKWFEEHVDVCEFH